MIGLHRPFLSCGSIGGSKMTQKRRKTKRRKKGGRDFVSFYDEIAAWFMIALSIFMFLSNFAAQLL